MAKNPPPGDDHRHGQVTDRSQTYNPHTDLSSFAKAKKYL